MTTLPLRVGIESNTFEELYEEINDNRKNCFFYNPLNLSEILEARVTNGRGYTCSKHPSRKRDKFPGFLEDLKKGHPGYKISEFPVFEMKRKISQE